MGRPRVPAAVQAIIDEHGLAPLGVDLSAAGVDVGDSELEAELAGQIAAAGLPAPTPQYVFHSTRKWRLDFAWPAAMVAAEVHGGTWTRGRHVRGGGFQKDREKMNEAQLLGWLVLEFTDRDVRTGEAVSVIERALKNKRAVE